MLQSVSLDSQNSQIGSDESPRIYNQLQATTVRPYLQFTLSLESSPFSFAQVTIAR